MSFRDERGYQNNLIVGYHYYTGGRGEFPRGIGGLENTATSFPLCIITILIRRGSSMCILTSRNLRWRRNSVLVRAAKFVNAVKIMSHVDIPGIQDVVLLWL